MISPRDSARRGAQLSFSHPNAYAICRAWSEEGVIADFRAPNILRMGFSPMILSFEDVELALTKLAELVRQGKFLDKRFEEKQRVT